MADLRFDNKNNQKKELSIFASGVVTTSATMDDTLFTLPKAALLTDIWVHVLTGAGTATDTVDIKVGSTVVANEVVVGTTGTKIGAVTPTYFPTGGAVNIAAGADAPGATGKLKVVVQYIETELTEGTYTD